MLTILKNDGRVVQVDCLRHTAVEDGMPLVHFHWAPKFVEAVRLVAQEAKVCRTNRLEEVRLLLGSAGYSPKIRGGDLVLPLYVVVLDENDDRVEVEFGLVISPGYLAAIGAADQSKESENSSPEVRRQRHHHHYTRGRLFRGANDGSELEDDCGDVVVWEPDIAPEDLDPKIVRAFMVPAVPPPAPAAV